MNYKKFGVLAFFLISLTSCNFVPSDLIKLDLVISATTQKQFEDDNRLYIRFDHESSGANKASKFINSRQATGWESFFVFPNSGVHTAVGCLPPNLIGFVDVHKNEAPKVRKNIELIPASEVNLVSKVQKNGTLVLKEYSQMELPEFSLAFNGVHQDILTLCSVNFSHAPKVDFYLDFNLIDGSIILQDKMLPSFEGLLGRHQDDETDVTVMGVTEIRGRRVGFTASTTLQVRSE